MEMKKLLRLRRKIKRKKPKFKRQEYFKYKRLGNKWRRPKGLHSKLRMREKGKGKLPKSGYGPPKKVRSLTKAGYKPIRIFNPIQLEKVDPTKEIVIIASNVGKKKRTEIVEKAGKLKVKIYK